MKLLAVYNTCGLRDALFRHNPEMVDVYRDNLWSIINQDYPVDIVWSAYENSDQCIKEVLKECPEYIKLYRPKGRLAVNHTFNLACLSNPGYDGYIYIASDVNFTDKSTVSKFNQALATSKYAIIYPQVTEDSGYRWTAPEIYPNFPEQDYIVPIGHTANAHCVLYSRKVLENYGALMPDVFTSYCTEAIFSYLCAAIKQQFVILKDLTVQHGKPGHVPGTPNHQVDGHTIAFGQGHNKVFPGARTIEDIIQDPIAKEIGFGYEEWHDWLKDNKPHLLHDPTKFTELNHAKDFRLKDFIKHNFYLGNLLDYSKITK